MEENDQNTSTSTETITTTNDKKRKELDRNNNKDDEDLNDKEDEEELPWFLLENKKKPFKTKNFRILPMDDIKERLKSIFITYAGLEELFRHYFKEQKLSIEEFITSYFPPLSSIKCSNYLSGRYYFICLTCSRSKERSNICVECFMKGNHVVEKHHYSLSYTPTISCLCDCGNPDALKSSGFCSDHCHADDYRYKQKYIDAIPNHLVEGFTTFFSAIIHRLTDLGSTQKKYKTNENEIADGITFLGKCTKKSPLFAQIIAQEFTLQKFILYQDDDDKDYKNNVKQEEEEGGDEDKGEEKKRKKSTTSSTTLTTTTNSTLNSIRKGKKKVKVVTPLEIIFMSHPSCASTSFYLFSSLSYHHKMFAQIFYQLYLTHLTPLLEPVINAKYTFSESAFHYQMFCHHPTSMIVPFATGTTQPNFYDAIIDSTTHNLGEMYHNYVRDKPQTKSCRFETVLLVKSVKFKECAFHVASNFHIIDKLLGLAAYAHEFVTPSQHYENILKELKELIQVETYLINTFNRLFKILVQNVSSSSSISSSSSTSSSSSSSSSSYSFGMDKIITLAKYIIDKSFELFKNIQYPDWCDLDNDIGTRFIFPLSRIIATIILQLPNNGPLQVQVLNYYKEKISTDSKKVLDEDGNGFTNMTLCDIASFRIFYYAHCSRPRTIDEVHIIGSPTDPDRAIKYYTTKSMMLDFFTARTILSATDPKYFLETILDKPFIKSTPSPDNLKSLLEFIINIIQDRSTLNPTDQELKYHYIQVASTGYFYYTEMLNLKFIFKNIDIDRKKRLIEEVVIDINDLEMKLKPDLWDQYDPYYWHFEYYYRITLQERSRNRLYEYQKSKSIPESYPWLPPKTPQLEPVQLGPAIYESLYTSTSFFTLLKFILLKMLVPGFINFKNSPPLDLSHHPVLSKVSSVSSSSSMLALSDILYLLILILNRSPPSREQFNFELLDDQKENLLMESSSSGITNILLNFIYRHLVEIQDKDDTRISILDALIVYWKNREDRNPLILQIFTILSSKSPDILNYLTKINGVNFQVDQEEEDEKEKEKRKKLLQQKRDEIMKQMKEKQQQFLKQQQNKLLYDQTIDNNNNDNEDEDHSTTTTSITSTSTTSTSSTSSTTNNTTSNNLDDSTTECCIICKDKSNTQPLYMMANVTHCSLARNQKLASIRKIQKRLIPSSNLVSTFNQLKKDIHEDDEEEDEDEDVMSNILYNKKMISKTMLEQFPSLVRFFVSCYELPSYIISCRHVTHRSCILSSIRDNDYSYNCPLCSSTSNILIPKNVPSLTIEEVSQFFLSFQLDPNDLQNSVFERHLWGMVFNNFDVFEMKTRKIKYCATPDQQQSSPDGYYYPLTDLEFKNELSTLRSLFRTIMICQVPPFPEDELPIPPAFYFHIDPVFLSTYLVYLGRLKPDQAMITSLQYYLFNFIVLESLCTELPQTKRHFDPNNPIQIYARIKSVYQDLDNNPRLLEYTLPIIRKIFLYNYLTNQMKNANDSTNQFTQSDFHDHDFLMSNITNIMPTKQSFKQSILDQKTFDTILQHAFSNNFLQKPNFTFSLPSSINHIPKFIKLHQNYFDFVKKSIPLDTDSIKDYVCSSCSKTKNHKCLSCGALVCSENCLNSFLTHPRYCKTGIHQVFYFIDISNGLVKIVDIDKSSIIYNHDYKSIYLNQRNEPTTMINQQLTLSPTHLQSLYKSWIQMKPTNTFNSLDQLQLF